MYINKNVVEFEWLIKNYSLVRLNDILTLVVKLHDLLSKKLEYIKESEERLTVIYEISILQANIQVIKLAINYLNDVAIRNTEYGQLSLN